MKIKNNYFLGYCLIIIGCFLGFFLNVFSEWKNSFSHPNQVLFIVLGSLLLIAYFFVTSKNKKMSENDVIFLVFCFGFILRLVYCCSIPFYVNQHDLDFGRETGHFGYMMRMYRMEGLPEVNTSDSWQFYQPPLWHIICAFFLKCQTALNISFEVAFENLQLISLFCSSSIMLLSYKLFKMFSLEGKSLCASIAIVAFHPTFIILSGSINNDVLALTLSLVSVILALKWYRRPNFKNIIFLALSIGFSMAVKLSAGLVSLGIATLFLLKILRNNFKNKKALVFQFSSFALVCVPLALWWQIRNLILFKVPITFVPMLSENNPQFVGNKTVFERLFDFSSIANGVYPARITKAGYFDYFDYNIPLTTLKTSVFGEYYHGYGTVFSIFGVLLFVSALMIALLAIFGSVYVLIKRLKQKNKDFKKEELIFTLICALTLVFSHLKFCFEYAHFCTMDFRYIALTVVFGALYVGLLSKYTSDNNKMFGKVVYYSTFLSVLILSVSSVGIYGTIL